MSTRRGVPLEWSFVLDGFRLERDQAITLDTTRVRAQDAAPRVRRHRCARAQGTAEEHDRRRVVRGRGAAGARRPGGQRGADAAPRLSAEAARHARAAGRDQQDGPASVTPKPLSHARATRSPSRCRESASSRAAIVPVSARDGANLRERGAMPGWYAARRWSTRSKRCPAATPEHALPLRMPVQDVYRHGDAARARRPPRFGAPGGRRRAGVLAVGARRARSPSSLAWPRPAPDAVEAGDNAFDRARPAAGRRARRHGEPSRARAQADRGIRRRDLLAFGNAAGPGPRVDDAAGNADRRRCACRRSAIASTWRRLAPELASTIAAGEIASVTLRAHELIAVDDFAAMPATGRFVLRDAYVTVGGGIVDASGYPDHRGDAGTRAESYADAPPGDRDRARARASATPGRSSG